MYVLEAMSYDTRTAVTTTDSDGSLKQRKYRKKNAVLSIQKKIYLIIIVKIKNRGEQKYEKLKIIRVIIIKIQEVKDSNHKEVRNGKVRHRE